MHHADIYAAMVKADWPPSKVADHLKVQRSAVTQVVRSQAKSYNIATFIAAKTGIPLNRLWPGAYAHRGHGRRRGAVRRVA